MAEIKYTSETKDFHPLVAQWLKDQGYLVFHEYTLPDVGRADFYAIHKATNQVLIVEAELWGSVGVGILQVVNYRVQIPDARIAIAAPSSKITKKHRRVASKYDVQIIEFEIGKKLKREKDVLDDFISDYIEMSKREYLWMEIAQRQSETIDKLLKRLGA